MYQGATSPVDAGPDRELASYANDMDLLRRCAQVTVRRYGGEQRAAPVEELMNEAYLSLHHRMPRFDPKRHEPKRFVLAVIYNAMKGFICCQRWRMSEKEYARANALRHTHGAPMPNLKALGDVVQEWLVAREGEEEEPASVARVREILERCPCDEDRTLLCLFMAHNGNIESVARELGCKGNALREKFNRLCTRAAQPTFRASYRCPLWLHDWLSGKTTLDTANLSAADRDLLDAVRLEKGNMAAAARRLQKDRVAVFHRLKSILGGGKK